MSGLTFWLLVNFRPFLACFSNNRCVNQRCQFLSTLVFIPLFAAGFCFPYLEMICDQTVKEVDIIFAEGAEVEEFINGSLLEGQLSET